MDSGGANTSSKPVSALVDSDTSKRYELLGSDVISIGKDPDNTIGLSNDPAAATCHALITRMKDGFWVEDLGSLSGTFVNHERVERPVMLKHGDSLLVGRTRFKVE